MHWHWGNIGSAAAGLAALIATLAAVVGVIRYGPAWLREGRARQQAQADAAREQASLAREQASQIGLERRRALNGWSSTGVDIFAVALVTAEQEMQQAVTELTGGGPTRYVICRLAESDEPYGDVNRARRLRQIIDHDGLLSRPPTTGERDALETGLDTLGIPRAVHA
jgi:fermentation-respiration switch protein FrsA (DUF1100 family)